MKCFFSLTPDSLSPAAPFLWSLFWDHRLGSRCHTTVCWFWPSDSHEASANSRAAQIYFHVMLLKYSKTHNSEHLLLHTRTHSPRNRIQSACCYFLLVAICYNGSLQQLWKLLHLTLNVVISLHRQRCCMNTKETKPCLSQKLIYTSFCNTTAINWNTNSQWILF